MGQLTDDETRRLLSPAATEFIHRLDEHRRERHYMSPDGAAGQVLETEHAADVPVDESYEERHRRRMEAMPFEEFLRQSADLISRQRR